MRERLHRLSLIMAQTLQRLWLGRWKTSCWLSIHPSVPPSHSAEIEGKCQVCFSDGPTDGRDYRESLKGRPRLCENEVKKLRSSAFCRRTQLFILLFSEPGPHGLADPCMALKVFFNLFITGGVVHKYKCY